MHKGYRAKAEAYEAFIKPSFSLFYKKIIHEEEFSIFQTGTVKYKVCKVKLQTKVII